MRNELKTLIAVGLGAVAVAAGLALRAPPRPAPALPVAAPAPAPAPAAPAPSAVAPASPAPSPSAPDEPVALEAGTSIGDVKVGGWMKGTPLPLCGRTGEVPLRAAPGAESEKGSLPSCEGAYSEFPSVTLIPIRSRKGEWLELPEGWVRIDEVRTAETLVVDGVEYWHDLFNASVARLEGRRVTLKGDTDPCAGTVCGDAHGQWEQEQALREQLAAAHPDGKVPPEALEDLDRRISELGAAAEKEHADAVEAAEHRAREERTFELPAAAVQGEKPESRVEGSGYLCCT